MKRLRDFIGCFEGQTVAIFGRGPSLIDTHPMVYKGLPAICHNDSAGDFECDFWFVTDPIVYRRCPAGLDKAKWLIAGSRCRAQLESMKQLDRTVLVDTSYFYQELPESKYDVMHTQYTGITGCIYLAWLFGARHAWLFGVDGWATMDHYYYDRDQRHPNTNLMKDVHVWLDKERFIAKVHIDRHMPAMRDCADWLDRQNKLWEERQVGRPPMKVLNMSRKSQHDAFPILGIDEPCESR